MFREQRLKLSQTFACKPKPYEQCAPSALLSWAEVHGSARAGTARWEHLTHSLAEGGSVPSGGGSRSGRNLPSQGFPFVCHTQHSSTRSSGLVGGYSSVGRAKHSSISMGRMFFTSQRGERITGA